MNLLAEIRENFASSPKGIRPLQLIPNEYPGVTVRMDDGYGVGILWNSENEVSEKFTNCKLKTRTLNVEGNPERYLILSCTLESLRYEFAALCMEFLEPGEEGNNRKEILNNPADWWTRWKSLLGNTNFDRKPYSVIAEMEVLIHLLETGEDVAWSGPQGGSHDIEGRNMSFEVKSTTSKYDSSIMISSQFQLKHDKPLDLYFCRMEKSLLGHSISDLATKLHQLNYDPNQLEAELSKLGFEEGSSGREEKFKLIEKRKYSIDDSFPVITEKSFKDDKIPKEITKITYTVDLNAISHTTW